MSEEILRLTDCGIYCPPGDFYIDPWKPVERAVITHAHSDHLRWGMGSYMCSKEGERVTRLRLGPEPGLKALEYGETVVRNGVKMSLHPAGHIIGSAQVRLELNGQVAVVSGDYKTEPDKTCTAFEPLKCHLFVTESTFGLPIYCWSSEAEVFDSINGWWRDNQEQGKASLLMGYPLGKSQRALSGVDPSLGPIFLHGAVHRLTEAYRESGVSLPETKQVWEVDRKFDFSKSLIIGPPSASASLWLRRFGDVSTAFASGWMAIRGARRRRAVDRGFVLSDHVDWPSLLQAIDATGAETVWVTHGYASVVARYLSEKGLDAIPLATEFEGELDSGEAIPGESEVEAQ